MEAPSGGLVCPSVPGILSAHALVFRNRIAYYRQEKNATKETRETIISIPGQEEGKQQNHSWQKRVGGGALSLTFFVGVTAPPLL